MSLEMLVIIFLIAFLLGLVSGVMLGRPVNYR